MNYEQVFQLSKSVYEEHNRLYGSTWKEWHLFSLLDIAASKARRARTHYEDGNYLEANEEAIDAINYLNFAVQKISEMIDSCERI